MCCYASRRERQDHRVHDVASAAYLNPPAVVLEADTSGSSVSKPSSKGL
jgi:hypothetical protein